jgi:hypothetical protein
MVPHSVLFLTRLFLQEIVPGVPPLLHCLVQDEHVCRFVPLSELLGAAIVLGYLVSSRSVIAFGGGEDGDRLRT